MILDLRNDATAFRDYLNKVVADYIARAAKSPEVPKVSAVEVAFEFAQRGWIIIHFDTRPQHKRDGHYNEKNLFPRPQWFTLVKALDYLSDAGKRKPAQLILPDGTEVNTATLSESDYSAALGDMLRVVLQAKSDGLFARLTTNDACQIDIEEFNGTWAWPEYDLLGKVNVI